jgi:hypothetical protein
MPVVKQFPEVTEVVVLDFRALGAGFSACFRMSRCASTPGRFGTMGLDAGLPASICFPYAAAIALDLSSLCAARWTPGPYASSQRRRPPA